MTSKAIRNAFAIGLCCVAVPSLIVGYDSWRGNRDVPALMKFVIPNSEGYFVSGPLRQLWETGRFHINSVFSDAASVNGRKAVGAIKQLFSAKCQSIDKLKDLSAIGVDETRGIAVSVANDGAFVAALPVRDRLRFAEYIDRIGLEPVVLSVPSDSEPSNEPISMELDPSQAENVSICSSQNPKPVRLIAGSRISITLSPGHGPQELKVSVIPTGIGSRKLGLSCSVKYHDGTLKDCQCTLAGNECPEQIEIPRSTMAMMHVKGVIETGVRLPSGFFVFYVDEGNTALVASTEQLAVAAAQVTENFAFFRGDDTLTSAIARVFEIRQRGEGFAFGAINFAHQPISGNVQFALSVGSDRVGFQILLPWLATNPSLLEMLAIPARRDGTREIPLSNDAEFRVDDPWLGYYLAQFGGMSGKIGNFGAFLDEVAKLDRTGPLRVGLSGVRDGAPDVVMSLKVPRSTAEGILLSLRRRFRESRDEQIIAGAATSYMKDHHGEYPDDIDTLLDGYIDDEAGALWSTHYSIENPQSSETPQSSSVGNAEIAFPWCAYIGKGVKYCFPGDYSNGGGTAESDKPKTFPLDGIKVDPTGIPDEWFLSSGYDFNVGAKQLRYIATGVTSNDFRYRVITSGNEKIDKDALRAGRFRSTAYFDDAEQTLFVGTDQFALSGVLKRSADLEIQQRPALEIIGSKISLIGDPRFLVSQGEIFPDQSVQDFVNGYLLDLVQYAKFKGVVVPLGRDHGIVVKVTFSHV